VEFLYKPEEQHEDLHPKQIYDKNFEKLNLDKNPELHIAAELVEK
jgi:hypothetical protein